MLYRALDNLSIGVRRWEVFKSERLSGKTLTLLETRGVIAPVISPPLDCTELWAARAKTLAPCGMETLADVVLFSGIPAGIEAATWAKWQAEARAALTVKCVGCGG